MDIKDLNKAQLILLAVLLSFVTSIATGITTVTLMQQAPSSVTVPITRVIRETVEKIVPAKVANNTQALSEEQKKLLEDLKAIKPLTVNLFLKGEAGKTEDKILGTGLFLGDNKVVIASLIPEPKEGEVYMVKSVLGEQKVLKVTQETDFTIIELVKNENAPEPVPPIDTVVPTEETAQ
ncbi:hypothetical protein A2814_00880 [Candidatus Nomurabacteria bacterium RIFCSPHIGHO2_01_FULL_38_19]|uniref:Uncharacterized protein n=1 Tax=Candidatus Nomurabacteria bacterium RIFCSPHIGHO2_01_FULL_38_19 TaxID=1801732 RepID=A0A1F6US27_9BACT|nr:MAG: hypothetical protein A2814_00880 [Candidatus Nomurabacteria bacterium RIFCSPHIGHO2_01_FULL_38_19]